uniref:Predicted nuclease, contains PIN domain, potential toxin-antitoxin system component n=1 Tax=Candidatus Kentrum eta TaxID=2126337 RepID=A0A450V073_9GAMM|nr:MAG: Predicted nuclease, contains PIN domain, potential toxin-antitoxin system component [Candidatus Kentron sp. H]VFJ91590.1 MAG: Predicted nuclease, contains PIN domain, potential toxin-antitoxin system component [Candidatus Kentron sp. H]VFJ98181.1 MAG: Predicted nuclease, contains PIN domain, potential toxin-antitoxin system component [Candidatus Kentron sp. H]
MKLLLDQNISRRIAPGLQADYPGSSQAALLGLELASDAAIWQFALENDFVIVTKDSDFEEMGLIRGSPPKVIWVKLGNVTNQVILSALIENRSRIEILFQQDIVDCIEIYAARGVRADEWLGWLKQHTA